MTGSRDVRELTPGRLGMYFNGVCRLQYPEYQRVRARESEVKVISHVTLCGPNIVLTYELHTS